MNDAEVHDGGGWWVDVVYLGAPLLVAFGLSTVAGAVLSTSAAIVSAVVIALVVGFVLALLTLDIDDWWDDFRIQNRATLVTAIGTPAAPALGFLFGTSLS